MNKNFEPHEIHEIQSALFLLREFLAEQKRLRDRGISLETLNLTLERLERKFIGFEGALQTVVRDQIEHGLRLDRYGKTIRDIRRQSSNGDDFDYDENSVVLRANERMQANEVVTIRKKIEEAEKKAHSDAKWWRRQAWHWIMTGFIGVVLALIAFLFGRYGLRH